MPFNIKECGKRVTCDCLYEYIYTGYCYYRYKNKEYEGLINIYIIKENRKTDNGQLLRICF